MPSSLQTVAASAPSAENVLPAAPSLGQHFIMMGFVGYALVILGVIGLVMIARRWRELSLARLMPESVRRAAETEIAAGAIDRAVAAASAAPSYFSTLLEGGLSMAGMGVEEMLGGVERAAARETMGRANAIANIARLAVLIFLMGVFGTVTGFIVSLDRLAQFKDARAADYAIGAAESLVSSAFGVFFAILCLGAFFVLDQRLTARSLRVHAEAEALVLRAAKHTR